MAYEPNGEALAQGAAEAMTKATAISRSKRPKVWMANAIGVDPRPFVEARSRIGKRVNTILDLANPDNVAKLIKKPKAGYHYAWASFHGSSKSITIMRAAQGQYRYVQPEDVKAEMIQAFELNKGTTGTLVRHGTLVLVEISPEAWTECFIEPEIDSVARLATQEEYFQAQIEQESEGTARGTIERVQKEVTLKEPAPSGE